MGGLPGADDDLADAAQPGARRGELAASLLAFPRTRADALTVLGELLAAPTTPATLRAALVQAPGAAPGKDADAALVAAFRATRSPGVFDQIVRRPESALALVEAIKAGTVPVGEVGPGNLARLRTHPNRGVAAAAAVLGAAGGGEKDALIAQLMPEVTKAGDVANGKALFTAACAICHKYGDVGVRDVGPPLAGIGSKSPLELLTHIVDPNRQVEPNYWQWNLTTRKGETLVGVIVAETAASLTLRNQGGDTEVRLADIANRENTRRSLMPEGLEGLGAAGLRDVIAYLAASSAPAPAPGAAAPAPTKKGGGGKAKKVAAVTPASAPAAAVAAATPAGDGPKEGGKNDRPLAPTEPVRWEAGKTRVLLIAGGSSHKFTEFFGATDSATLRAAGFTVHYTEDRDQAAAVLPEADVAVISVNRMFFDTPAYRQAVFAFAAAGKGIVMLHPGTWYAFPRWPELNARLVGGGSRGHDKLGPYSVNVLKADHPITRGVPAKFEVTDELYYVNAEPEKIPAGTAAIEVLAESSPSIKFSKPHPVVWITRHDTAKVVGFTLGHDERTHDHPAFKTLLVNAVKWVGGK